MLNPIDSLTQELARFAVEVKFEDIPVAVVDEAKRIILDSFGCAIAGLDTDKGKISINLARRFGGSPESSIIGVGDKVSCYGASFANGELINALDYDALLVPPIHVSPYVIPAPLSLAEAVEASGKDLILAIVLSHEIATRVSQALNIGTPSTQTEQDEGSVKYSPIFGVSQCVLAGVLGAGKILRLDHRRMSYALGIAGHFCPVHTWEKWRETVPSAMTKFGSAGWLSATEVTAALLAESGYIGDTTVLDGEYGFWRFFGSERWKPEAVMEHIGETWFLMNTIYKRYPCCGIIATALDCFINIIDKTNLLPEDIEIVNVFSSPEVEKPLWKNTKLASHVDAQFSVPYIIAIVAYRVKVGAEWQDLNWMTNPKILEFMKRVNCYTHPHFKEAVSHKSIDLTSAVEVRARGKWFKEERRHEATSFADLKIKDDELVRKFQRNASGILSKDKVDEAVSSILRMETIENLRELMKQVTL
jgi:2-methylcitrate dehydratase PrpD